MNNKQILIGLAFLVVGVLTGFGFASRHYGVGPLAGLQAVPSSADYSESEAESSCDYEVDMLHWAFKRYNKNPSVSNLDSLTNAYRTLALCTSGVKVKGGMGGEVGGEVQ